MQQLGLQRSKKKISVQNPRTLHVWGGGVFFIINLYACLELVDIYPSPFLTISWPWKLSDLGKGHCEGHTVVLKYKCTCHTDSCVQNKLSISLQEKGYGQYKTIKAFAYKLKWWQQQCQGRTTSSEQIVLVNIIISFQIHNNDDIMDTKVSFCCKIYYQIFFSELTT